MSVIAACIVIYAICFMIPFPIKDFLDLPGGNHLLPQEVLVFPNRAVPSPDRLIFADHNLLCDLIEQSGFRDQFSSYSHLPKAGGGEVLPKIVRHNHYTAAEGVYSIRQRINGGNIQSVCRFVQKQHVRSFDGQQCEYNPALLTF